MSHPHHSAAVVDETALRVLAWETTRACTLACPHCRAAAVDCRDSDELTTEEGKRMLESAAELGSAIIILSGGEPLLRDDLEEISAHAIKLGHRPVISCNDGSLLTDQRLKSLYAAGIRHFSFSMHSADEKTHDDFVRVKGAYQHALAAFKRIKAMNQSFQINTSVLPGNHKLLPQIKDWVIGLGASAWHLFFIVPTGRASSQSEEINLTQSQIDKVLHYVAADSDSWPIPVKVTCAPQYARIRAQMGLNTGSRGRSCMAGAGFVFVSYRGEVKPCGYFSMVVGNLRDNSLAQIYREATELNDMRDSTKLEGICGQCRFNKTCGGCRARAYAVHGSYMAADPNCNYSTSQQGK